MITCKMEKRVILTKDNEIKIKEFPIRALKSGQVLIQTICNLISAGTELGVQGAYSEYSSSWSEFEYIVQPPAWVGSIARKVEWAMSFYPVVYMLAI